MSRGEKMPVNQHHRHRLSFVSAETLDNQHPSSPIDADFTVPPTRRASVFSQQAIAPASPMDVSFPDPFSSECSAARTTASSTATMRSFSQMSSYSVPKLARLSQNLNRRRTNKHRPAFAKKLREMSLPLAPLVQLTTGQVHPSFPSTLLNYWLLTEPELDSLAQFYHQQTPSRWTHHYPCPVSWDPSAGVEEKRRRIGKFIGLKGCEMPVQVQSEDEIMEEARRARERDEEAEVWRRKLQWY